jgi:probable rRNA maturation factor
MPTDGPIDGPTDGDDLVIFQKRVAGLSETALDRFVTRVQRTTGFKGEVNVFLTSSAQMKALNHRFLRKDQPTDVLSFPAEPGDRKSLRGEIAVSVEIAARNARILGHSSAEEIKILILHGMLHLRGYDHERDHGRMARRERQLRLALNLPAGLIERSATGKQPDSAPKVTRSRTLLRKKTAGKSGPAQ